MVFFFDSSHKIISKETLLIRNKECLLFFTFIATLRLQKNPN